MRPVDLAREHGLSTQAVRNYEDEGVLPPAERSDTGYRRYTAVHAQALRAFLALRGGHGHQRAMEIMRAVNRVTGSPPTGSSTPRTSRCWTNAPPGPRSRPRWTACPPPTPSRSAAR
nr:hypothetical protein GCM10017745_57970 [Saccharothrix mutabilis subsp. capreolus]